MFHLFKVKIAEYLPYLVHSCFHCQSSPRHVSRGSISLLQMCQSLKALTVERAKTSLVVNVSVIESVEDTWILAVHSLHCCPQRGSSQGHVWRGSALCTGQQGKNSLFVFCLMRLHCLWNRRENKGGRGQCFLFTCSSIFLALKKKKMMEYFHC